MKYWYDNGPSIAYKGYTVKWSTDTTMGPSIAYKGYTVKWSITIEETNSEYEAHHLVMSGPNHNNNQPTDSDSNSEYDIERGWQTA